MSDTQKLRIEAVLLVIETIPLHFQMRHLIVLLAQIPRSQWATSEAHNLRDEIFVCQIKIQVLYLRAQRLEQQAIALEE